MAPRVGLSQCLYEQLCGWCPQVEPGGLEPVIDSSHAKHLVFGAQLLQGTSRDSRSGSGWERRSLEFEGCVARMGHADEAWSR